LPRRLTAQSNEAALPAFIIRYTSTIDNNVPALDLKLASCFALTSGMFSR